MKKNQRADKIEKFLRGMSDRTWKKVLLWTFGILLSPYLWWLYLIIFIYWQVKIKNKKTDLAPTAVDTGVVSITKNDDFITIQETKNTCTACGNIWFFGKEELAENKNIKSQNRATNTQNCGAAMQGCGKSMMCCSGCAPAVFIPVPSTKDLKDEIDLSKCPKCGSRAIEQEIVSHKVKK